MSYIYCVTNTVNNKKYVGKSAYSLEKRWKEHCNDYNKERCEKRPLYDAMSKYGIDKFILELLEECDEINLSSAESYWIETLETFKDGYNATLGGDGSILFDYQLIVNTFNTGLTVKATAEKIGCCIDTVRDVLRLYKIDSCKHRTINTSKSINQLDLNGKYLKTFKSTMEAIQWLYENGYTKSPSTGNSSHLGQVANGKQNTAYKFKWEWTKIGEDNL